MPTRYVIEKSKKDTGPDGEPFWARTQTIASLVDDILDHYENYRAHLLTGKAMIVAYSRPIAMKIYKQAFSSFARTGRKRSLWS